MSAKYEDVSILFDGGNAAGADGINSVGNDVIGVEDDGVEEVDDGDDEDDDCVFMKSSDNNEDKAEGNSLPFFR